MKITTLLKSLRTAAFGAAAFAAALVAAPSAQADVIRLQDNLTNDPASLQLVQRRGWEYEFQNNCRHPVQIVIHYRDMRGRWRSEGWWQFRPRERARLEDRRGRRLRSTNAIWYYYAETTNGAGLTWSGDQVVRFGGRTLNMRRKEDQSGVNTWAVRCPGE